MKKNFNFSNKKNKIKKTSFREEWEYNKGKIIWVFKRWRKHLVWLSVLFVMTIISTISALAYPFLFGNIVNLIKGDNQNIAFKDNYAYVTDGKEGFIILDTSDINNPVKLGSLKFREGILRFTKKANDVVIAGNYAFIALGDSGLQIVDISNPEEPLKVARWSIDPENQKITNLKLKNQAEIKSITLDGNNAYLACGKNGINVVDISDPLNPVLLGFVNTPGTANSIKIQGDYGYVADGEMGLQVIDFANPSTAEIIGNLKISTKITALHIDGDFAYVATRDKYFRVIDISIPEDPIFAHYIATGLPTNGMDVENGTAYLACGDAGLKLLSVENLNDFCIGNLDPSKFESLAGIKTPGSAENVSVLNGIAYLLSGFSGLQVIDVNDKEEPKLIASNTWRDSLLAALIVAFAVVGVLRVLAAFYPSFRALINLKIDMDVRNNAFARILTKSQRYFLRFRTGDLVTRLTDDIYDYPKISWFCCSGIFRAVESTSKVIFCLAYMFTQSTLLTFIAFMPLPFMLVVFGRYQRSLRDSYYDVRQAASETNNSLESCFSGIRILKAYNGEEHQAQLFDKVLEDRFHKEMRVVYLWTFIWHLYPAINMIGQVIVLGMGSWLIFQEQFQIGTMYMFYVYMDMLLHPLLDIPNLFTTSRDAFACIDRQIEMHEFDSKNDENPDLGGSDIERLETIELVNVSHSYEKLLADEKEEILSTAERIALTRQRAMEGLIEVEGELIPVLNNINMKIKQGSKIAIVGSVGSGKTTLVKLITRILKPSVGDIRINSKPADEFDIRKLRRLIGYVPQEVVLFSDSISDNISFGRDVDKDEIIRVLGLAQVKDEVMAFEKSLDTILGQRGQTVSGGQKQRLAIARALAGKPDLLILDDCTAALDAENEEKFWDDMHHFYPGTTCVIVTHRISTAKRADVIYVIENGTITHSGTHNELLKNSSLYQAYQAKEPVVKGA
ncbi:MAG: ATP-binding cassette domain-containing protein [bacterium]